MAAPSSFDRQAVTQANVTATVKWFNASKGFGFVAPADGTPDAFLHISALERAGMTQIAEGATIVCDLGQGNRGPQVVMVHEIDSSTAAATAPRAPRADRGPSQTVEGTVKFFSAEKGFGFVQVDEGGKDVFVHIKALERSGLKALESGQRVRVTTTLGQKGPQADTVAII
ncbi:cold-shock protein [Magnetospirillum sp. UT-4]|uniref:cold-shock protein n=1 Tax=Magnetospirillum sp. UT-4 TaxID=2681467 RepID=UPI002738D719|nr:cold shock domain-containing protein [Magnetospirillum sp. UT-4]